MHAVTLLHMSIKDGIGKCHHGIGVSQSPNLTEEQRRNGVERLQDGVNQVNQGGVAR